MSRKYLLAAISGTAIFVLVYVMDIVLARMGLHAETTFLDDFLLAVVVAALVFVLQWQHERELQRQKQCAEVIALMNHHIRNALQVIVSRSILDDHTNDEIREINAAVDRIDHALREILPAIHHDSDALDAPALDSVNSEQ